MGAWGGVVFRALAAIVATAVAVWLALWYFIPAPPSTISMAIGFRGGAFEHIADRYREKLAQHHIKLNLHFAEGAVGDLKLIENENSGIDATFLFGGITNGAPPPGLLSLGRITYNPIWIFYRGSDPLDRISQIKGKRIGSIFIFPPVRKMLDANGINESNTTQIEAAGPAQLKALKDGKIDVAIFLGDLNAPVTQTFLHDPLVHLMNLTQAEGLARTFPYLNRLVLPQGVVDFEKNIPATDVSLIATTTAVVVRKTLHPELIYLLAQTMQEEHGAPGVFQRAGDFPTQTDPEFPMAEEARDYYKNGPSFLHRYLPFWMVSYAKRVAAILLTTIAVIIPIFSYAPRLYVWVLQNYAEKLYRRLRAVEAGLKTDLNLSQIKTLQADLETIDQAAHILPMRRSSLFFDLTMHIDLTRTRLASRLVTMRGQAT